MVDPAPEFSRTVPADLIGPQVQEHRIEASAAERRALAERFELAELKSLLAVVRLQRPNSKGLIHFEACFEAELVQTCVVTLEPIESHVKDRIVLQFGRATAADGAQATEIDIAIDEEDPPEPIVSGDIDMGEAVAQGLALALDPYPRKPGASLEAGVSDLGDAEASANPFAALAPLRKKD
ncbi:MAG: DUF177 domain-containing protein [Proteobacteria bacterium]|nr:DUF177 domain-containing protein [Pseudomonadota bacterium]MBI3496032.1 DUF177 domain-containing protein [Pseudomonadota bacterium]